MNAQIGNRAGIWIIYYWHLGDSVCGGSFCGFRILCWISWISLFSHVDFVDFVVFVDFVDLDN